MADERAPLTVEFAQAPAKGKEEHAAPAPRPAPRAPGRESVIQAKSRFAQARAGQGLGPGVGAEPAALSARELLTRIASEGTANARGALPHLETIQGAFGHHDLSGLRAQVGGAAGAASEALGAEAFAFGDAVAFREEPDLGMAAHEAAHFVQQQRGVRAAGGMGQVGDAYERHADAVAEAVVRGDSAEGLLDQALSGPDPQAIQRIEGQQAADRTTETRHLVVRGDTLSGLSRRYLGDPRRWREIKARNTERVHGTDTIIRGDTLIIPAATTAEGDGGGSGEGDGGTTEAVSPVEMLRTSVQAQDGLSAMQTWRTLSADERAEVQADPELLASFMGVVSRADALQVVADCAGDPAAQLELAAQRTPVEPEFLTAALAQAGVDSPETLVANASTLTALVVYADAAVLDPIVNGTATAEQQVQLLVDPNCAGLLRDAYGASPLTYMAALIADPYTAREAMVSFEEVRRQFLEDPVSLHAVILSDPDPFAWFLALVQLGELDELAQMIAQEQATWGELLLNGLATLSEAQTTAINEHGLLQSNIIAACLMFGGDTVAPDVAAGLRLDLPSTIVAFDAAAVLTADMASGLIGLADAAGQKLLADHQEAMTIVVRLHPEGDPVAIFAQLVSAPTDFTAATIACEAFAGWVARDEAQLKRIIAAVVDWPGWAASFKHYGNWELFLSVASDPALTTDLRGGLIATTGGYNWLVTACTKPLSDDTQATTLLAMYGLGAGIDLADKYTTWACLYRARLGRVGDDIVRTWGLGTTHTKRWTAVDPDSQAMDLFFNQMRQIPRNHIDTASLVIMCPYFTHFVNPFIGANHFVDDDGNTIPAPGRVAMGTSYYFGAENAIVMRSTNMPVAGGTATPAGTADTGAIGNSWGTPGAVNTPQTGPLSPGAPRSLSYFENHVTHEFGHSVGARTLSRDGYDTTPDQWTKDYADWRDDGDAESYARILGFTEAMDDTEYTLAANGTTLNMDGDDIREFLTDIAEGEGVADDDPADHFGSVAMGMTAIKSDAALAGNLLVRTVDALRTQMPNRTFRFPFGITAGATRVHFYCTRWTDDWVTYKREALDNRVSWYSLSSYKEMFAEMYTAKYTGGALPPAIGPRTPAVFFASLEAASPEELGMPADSSGADGDTAEDDYRDPNAGDIRPWP